MAMMMIMAAREIPIKRCSAYSPALAHTQIIDCAAVQSMPKIDSNCPMSRLEGQ